jgi:ABC-type antimicrobial peptide transport system permease subunit
MDEALAAALAPRRVNLMLVGAFAGLALVLSAAGVYAVTAFSVALRRREMAVRAALGARAGENLRAIVSDAARPIAAGLLVGLTAAFLVAPALRSLLFDVDPLAAGPFVVVGGVLLAAGLTASLVAALPIRRIDPVEALRLE